MVSGSATCSRFSLLVMSASVLLAGCRSDVVHTDLRVYSSPYAGVDWVNTERLKAQHHDHIGARATRILAYDAAGYDVLSLMDYSGNATLAHAWQERIWPPERWVPAWTLSSLENLKFFLPNAEEVGDEQHATSPFLTTYIEGVFSSPRIVPNEHQYRTIPEMFELIRAKGGFPCLAHPWFYDFDGLEGAFCTEIYSAFAEAQRHAGRADFVGQDRNKNLLAGWDRALQHNQRVFGIAVNDHYGPYRVDGLAPAEIVDSGKIVVLAREATLDSYRAALQAGAFFAVRDMDAAKDQYPHVFSISVDEDSVFIETAGDVRWISGGHIIGTNPLLLRSELPPNARYLRAEISATNGASTVYTQAFTIRPVGDIDGNYVLDEADDRICAAVMEDDETNPLYVAACTARDRRDDP